MGGREVGGLANQLAAHMDFRPTTSTACDGSGMRRDGHGAGLKAVELFEAIERGAIKALWIMSTNPAVSLPRADAMRAALGKLDFLVVSEISAHVDGLFDAATVVLPAAAWGEKDGTSTNSERRISRQRSFRARRAKRCRIGSRCAKSHGDWATVRPSPIAVRPTSFASTRRYRRSRTTARGPSTSARWRPFQMRHIINSTRSCGRRAKARDEARNAFSTKEAFLLAITALASSHLSSPD